MAQEVDIFNLGTEDVNVPTEKKKSGNSDIYTPKADDGKDSTYKAVIRFVPNPENPRNSIVKKFSYWLESPSGNGKGFIADSPSTIGEQCPIVNTWRKLFNSDSAADKKLAKELRRSTKFYSIVQIVKDPQNPELEGQYKIFRFGKTINDKIEAELKPEFQDDESVQVFDFFNGKNFKLIITKKDNYNNYDRSGFDSKITSIKVGGKNLEKNQESVNILKAEIEKFPNLKEFEYSPWDDEMRNRVNNVLAEFTGGSMDVSTVVNNTADVTEEDTTAVDQFLSQTSKNVAVTEEPTAPVNSGEDDELDSFLNNM